MFAVNYSLIVCFFANCSLETMQPSMKSTGIVLNRGFKINRSTVQNLVFHEKLLEDRHILRKEKR